MKTDPIKLQLEAELEKVHRALEYARWEQGPQLVRERKLQYLTGRAEGLQFAIAVVVRKVEEVIERARGI